ncbi:hypothetical protein [Actinocorallia populi]|uniref:hypothetical protein n=1 Tax=Actinocorallia populi TaxID=2079200 RepID=UPI00130065FE|nr:hypothetical protein [Actinocorallia populi]
MHALDDNTLEELAHLICGDDGPLYRSGPNLAKFLTRAGWPTVPPHDGTPRRSWILARLRERRNDPQAMEAVLLRLADSREYLGEPSATVNDVTRELNAFLVHEGYKVTRAGGAPRLVECSPGSDTTTSFAPELLREALDKAIAPSQLRTVLRSRLDEAVTCYENGSHVAAIIMLGSLIEGILIDAMMTRPVSVPPRADLNKISLDELLTLAQRNGWIGNDVTKYPCAALRQYRNLVHPRAQMRMPGPPPDRDTVELCWPVVRAVLNDLIDTRGKQTNPATPSPAQLAQHRRPPQR